MYSVLFLDTKVSYLKYYEVGLITALVTMQIMSADSVYIDFEN